MEYKNAYKQLKRFLTTKYKVQDIPLNQLDLLFIEAFDFHLCVELKMTDESVATVVFLLFKVVRLVLHRNLITYAPFLGFMLKKPKFQIRSLTKEEFERLSPRRWNRKANASSAICLSLPHSQVFLTWI